MAIPDQVQVPSGQHKQRFVPASFVANSISVLNPNNGVVFVARNRDCISTGIGAWDWKVPSQSYAYLPGPFQSVGLYYQDQSGAAVPGDISTYASEQKLDWPHFQAIGLTLASVVTTLDIGMGNKPVPPASNNVRLWADGTGNLHIEMSDGSDKVVLDSSNYATYVGGTALGGDLSGTVANGHVNLVNNSPIQSRDSGGTTRRVLLMGGDNATYLMLGSAGYLNFFDDGGNGVIASLNNAGNMVVKNDVNTQSISLLQGGGSNNAVIYWRDNSHYLQYAPAGNTSLLQWTHDFGANGQLTAGGNVNGADFHANRNATSGAIFLGSSSGAYLYFDGSQFSLQGGPLYPAAGLTANTINRAALQSSAQVRKIGGYNANPAAWSTTSTGWVKTPITFSATVTASKSILWTWNVHFYGSLVSNTWEYGLGLDNMGTFFQQMGAIQTTTGNQVITAAGAQVFDVNEVPSGAHTFEFWVYNPSGTLNLWTNDRAYMSASELMS